MLQREATLLDALTTHERQQDEVVAIMATTSIVMHTTLLHICAGLV